MRRFLLLCNDLFCARFEEGTRLGDSERLDFELLRLLAEHLQDRERERG